MQTFARISPNKKGQPLKVGFAIQALAPLRLDFGQRVSARIEGDTLILTPDPDGPHIVQAMSKPDGKQQAPTSAWGRCWGRIRARRPWIAARWRPRSWTGRCGSSCARRSRRRSTAGGAGAPTPGRRAGR